MARRRSTEPDDDTHPEPIDGLRELCRKEGLRTSDASLLRMVNGTLGSKLTSVDDIYPSQIREVCVRVRATRSLFGPLENAKGQEWFLRRKTQEVEDERTSLGQ